MVVRKIIERILEEGQTTITITDTDIPGSLIRTYSNDPDLMPVQLVLTGSTLKIDYEAQSSDKYVAVELVKQGLDIIDNLTSTDTDAALSAKQGKVLKDLVDYITPIRELTELDDVLVTDLTDGDILKYDAEEEMFVNYALPTIPVYLSDLGDIVLDSVTQGQILTYNGAYWTNADPTDAGEKYTTEEQVIGTFLGKPLYRKSFVFTNAVTCSSQTWTRFPEAAASNIANIVSSFFEDANGTLFIPTGTNVDSGTFGVLQTRNANVTAKTFTVEYTKTTD